MKTQTIAKTRIRSAQRLRLHNVSWREYLCILRGLGDRRIRATYDRGELELMSPSPAHESYKTLLGRFLEVMTEELNIPMRSGGSTTFHRKDLDRGLEPDECYWIENEPAVRGKKKLNLAIDPPPDLAIEVDVTSSSLNRMNIYAQLRVPQVWRFDGENLRVYVLGPKGEYQLVEHSPTFPWLSPQDLVHLLKQSDDLDETTLIRSFRARVRAQARHG